MRETIITGKRKKQEILVLAICLGIACILNILSILVYKTDYKELYSELPTVIIIALLLYLLSIGIRAGLYFIHLLILRIKKK